MGARNTLSNTQFRPRRIGSGNASVPSGHKTMEVPTHRAGQPLIKIKRNARAGKKYQMGPEL